MIKVSVIVPVYKVPLEYLRECFDSLLSQTMQECEFIVVSDGAPDAECSVCEEYAAKDPRFKFFRREHAGVSTTRNYGIKQAQGEYITFVDSDDTITSQSCLRTFNFAQRNNSDIVLWDASRFKDISKSTFLFNENREKLSPLEIRDLCANIIYASQVRYNSASLVCCKLFRKKIISSNNITYPEDLSFSEDRIFNISAYAHARKISYLKASMYYYRFNENSTSLSYTYQSLDKYIRFFQHLNIEQQTEYKESISTEYIRLFFLSWSTYYFHPSTCLPPKRAVKELSSIIDGDTFQKAIRNKKFKLSSIIEFELFFFRFKFKWPLYFHAAKAIIIKHFF